MMVIYNTETTAVIYM